MKSGKIISFLLAFAVSFGSIQISLPVSAAEISNSVENYSTLADYALENNMLRYDSQYSDPTNPYHTQGFCVDDELKYMYLSCDQILKIDMETGCVVGSLSGFSTVSGIANMNGMHLGSLEYHDGWVYSAVIAGNPYGKLMVIAIEASKIDRMGMQVNDISGSVRAVLLKDHMEDYCDPVDESIFTQWKGPGSFGMFDQQGHRFGNGGADGITVGTYPGDKSGKQYIIASYGTYASEQDNRQDNNYTILKFYALEDIWNSDKTPTLHNIEFHKDDNTVESYGVKEALTAEKTLFLYTGNLNWGPQNIVYEKDTGDIGLYCYEPTEFKADFENWSRVMIIVDGSKAPEEKVLELGQNNTLADSEQNVRTKKIADAYSVDTNGDGIIDDNERLTGPVGTLKCICGNPEKHTADSVGDACWKDTGVKKSEYPICCTLIFNTWDARADEGIDYIGKGSDGAQYFYTRGGYTQTEVNLWKRTINASTGKYNYEYASPQKDARKILHYSMDESDIIIENGVKYMKNTLDDKYHAIVEGTTPSIGVDGSEKGAMSFNSYNYPYSVDQMSLSKETITYINTRINGSAYSYSFWAKMATNDDTDGNFVPFLGFYRGDGTYAGVFEQRWRGEVKYSINGIGDATAGTPGEEGISIGKKDNGWHFYTVTEKDGVGTVYCDGKKQDSYSVTADHLHRNFIQEFIVGGAMSKIFYDKNNRGRLIGTVDDLTIYSGALTAEEAKAAYNQTTKNDNSKVTAVSADISTLTDNKIRANYDKTSDNGNNLNIETGIEVNTITGLTKDTDYTVSGTIVTLKSEWLSKQNIGIQKLSLNDSVELELTLTDVNEPILDYQFVKDNVVGGTVKDSSAYKVDAVTTAKDFVANHTGSFDGALLFDGYNYSNPQYVKLKDEDALWLNSVLKNGYTMNFWAYAESENGSVMSIAGLYANDARPLGTVESYEPSSSSVDNSLDKEMTIQLDVAKKNGKKENAENSCAAVSMDKIDTESWNMYTATYDKATNEIKLYINGVLKATSSTDDDIIGNISQLFVGHQYKKYYNATGYYDWLTRGGFKGAIDGIRIYNNALSSDKISELYGNGAVTGLTFFEDDFEEYNGSLDGSVYTLGGSANGGKMEIATEGSNHILNVTKVNSADNVTVTAILDKTYTTGTIYLDYSVKPATSQSVMMWLKNSAGKQIRVPLFTNTGEIKVTGEGVTETKLGTFTAGEWYDVSAKVNLESAIMDVTVTKRSDGSKMSKTGIAIGIVDISQFMIQTWSSDGTSGFDNIIFKRGKAETVTEENETYVLKDDFENGLSGWSQVGSATSNLEIGTEDTNKFLNIINNDDNVCAERWFIKAYSSGTLYVDYKVKPVKDGATMFYLNTDMRVPFFGSDGAIIVTDKQTPQGKAERKIGTWESGYWYDVSMKLDLDAGKYDLKIKKSGEDSYVAQIIEDYTNITSVDRIRMQMYGQKNGAYSSFDDMVIKHENTKLNERLLFKDTYEYYKDADFDNYDNRSYIKDGNGSDISAKVYEENGNHSAALKKTSADDNIQLKKYLREAYSTGVINLSYSVKPASGVSTMIRMVNDKNNTTTILPFFSSDGIVRIAGNGDIDFGTYTSGKWYDISAKMNLSTKKADITVTERDTGTVMSCKDYSISNDNVYEVRMQIYTGEGTSYFDDIIVTHTEDDTEENTNLPYSNDFENGMGSMVLNGNDNCQIVDSDDGHGKVYKLYGDGTAPKIEYNLGGLTKGKLKIEADIKTGENTLSTLLQLNDNNLPNLVQFGNKDNQGIWFGWQDAKYAGERLENAWYHVNIVLDLDRGIMDSRVIDPNGKIYTVKNQKYAEPNTRLETICFRTWNTGTCYVDNIKLSIPTNANFEILGRKLMANEINIADFETLRSAVNPILNVEYLNPTGQDKSVMVYVGAYKDKQLIDIKQELLIIGSTEEEGIKPIDISDVSFTEADSVGVFVWDLGMCPLFNTLKMNAHVNAE